MSPHGSHRSKLWGLYWQTDRQTDRRREVGWPQRQNGQLVFWLIGKLFISGMRCEGRKSQHLCTPHYRWSMRTLVSGYHQAKNNTNGDDSSPPAPFTGCSSSSQNQYVSVSQSFRLFRLFSVLHAFLCQTLSFLFCFFLFFSFSGDFWECIEKTPRL